MSSFENHDIAQVCMNGHMVNSSSKDYPEFNKKFCSDCGAKTITKCTSCDSPIRGRYRDSMSVSDTPVSRFCENCGKSYPWVLTKIEAARELADEFDLSDDDKELLKKSIDEIVTETPKTEVGAIRFKKIMVKLGKESAEGFKKILIDIISETAKKILYQGQ